MGILETLYDHYKDTYSLSKNAQLNRNKMFIILCVLEALSFLMGINSELTIRCLQEIINKDADTIIILGSTIAQTLLWILILYVFIRYIQNCIYIERQYIYIANLEKIISQNLGWINFDRESRNYIDNFPIILDIIDAFYKWFSPLLFLALNIYRLVIEWYSSEVSASLICNSIIFLMIVVVAFFYLVAIHPRALGWVNKLFFWRH